MSDLAIPRRQSLSPISLAAIFVTGMIPIVGVLFLGWDAIPIVLLYWFETVIAGVFTWLRLRSIERHVNVRSHADETSGFFWLHYGVFTLVHGIFVLILAVGFMSPDGAPGFWRSSLGDGQFWLALASILLLAALVFWRDWIRPQAWRTADAGVEMFRPYGRIIAMHLMVTGGFWVLTSTGGAAWMVVGLCGVKLFLDLILEVVGSRRRLKFASGSSS